MQVVLVYLEQFRCNSRLKCVLQPEITKNSLKPPILGVQGHSRSSMLVPPESPSAVLVMMSRSLCLSAIVLTLDEPIVIKLRFLRGGGTPL